MTVPHYRSFCKSISHKMYQETDKTLLPYYDAIKCYEDVERLFHNKHVDFTKIKNGLQNCLNKIEIIILEEDSNCKFLIDLFQLKQSVNDITNFIEIEQPLFLNICNTKKPYELILNKPTGKENQELIRTVEATIETPRIKGFKEIAGLWKIKKILNNLIILPRSQPQLFTYRKSINSILLFGPPGTGKTQLVHALAHEAGAVLYSVSVSNILSPLVGLSERNIKFLFDYINNTNSFSILFIDEVDGFCRKRSSSEQEFSRRLKTELLCQISKMESNPNFFLISATNCPWDLDTAFLRRFQRRIYVPLPNYAERRDLFRIFTKETPLAESTNNWEILINQTNGFSGSDIANLVQVALNDPILELEDTTVWKRCPDGFYEPVNENDVFDLEDIVYRNLNDLPPRTVRARDVRFVDLIKAIDNVNVTVSEYDVIKYEMFVNQ